MRVRPSLKGKSNGISFVVAYVPTDRHTSVRAKYLLSTPPGSTTVVAEVPKGEHLLVMMDATLALPEGGKDVSITRCWVHAGGIR